MTDTMLTTPYALSSTPSLNMDFEPMTAEISKQEGIIKNEKGTFLRLHYENAKQVELQLFDGDRFSFSKDIDGFWILPLDDNMEFCYIKILVDGQWVLSPYLPLGYGDNHPLNFLDIAWVSALQENIAHGSLHRHTYWSSFRQREKFAYIYTPYGYEQGKDDYPVLYIQHGYGENELGWIYQGRLCEIADRLIAQKKMVPMIIVSSDGMMSRPLENGNYTHYPKAFSDELIRDIMPSIESTYRIKKGKLFHALAGLSMGSLQTTMTLCAYPDVFSWAGIFSGFMTNIFDTDSSYLEAITNNADTFNQDMKLLFRAMGDKDPFWGYFRTDDKLCEKYGIRHKRLIYSGGHTWNVWRNCLLDFLPALFREEEIEK